MGVISARRAALRYVVGVFELTVEAEFCAAHAILLGGRREPSHGHNFHVTAALSARHLDAEGLGVDFHAVESALQAVIEPWKNRDLNQSEAFRALNPSAENIAFCIADLLERHLLVQGVIDNSRVRVAWVRVTEAPGCAATCFRIAPSTG